MENTAKNVETKKTESTGNKPLQKKVLTLAEVRARIYNRIKSTYNSEKGKGFISHLIRSFMPISKVSLIQKPSGKMECCITNKGLISLDELSEILKEQDSEKVIEYLSKKASDWESKGNGETSGHPMDKLLKGKFTGVTCTTSEKYLSEMAWQELNRFVTDEVTNGNEHIAFLIVDQHKKSNSPKKQMDKPRPAKDWKAREEKQVYVNPDPIIQDLSDNPTLKMLSEKFSKEETEVQTEK